MAKEQDTIWKLQPHTAAKHTILKKYLQAWMPIMTLGYNYNKRAIIWDGFAGPGIYSNGEDGSPVIRLKEALKYLNNHREQEPQLRFIFVEPDKNRYNNLHSKILELFDNNVTITDYVITPNDYKFIKIFIIQDKFESFSENLLEKMDGKMAPCFAFIDPFGFKDTPYYLIEKFAKNNRSEVFINFMYESINRFLKLPSLQNHYHKLFGTQRWTGILDDIESYSPEERRYFLHKLYKEQLHNAGFEYVISFEMKNENNATEYFLYYGTNHIKGLEKMKDAMWSVDNSGAYTFSDYEANQTQLRFVEFDAPDLNILADEIYSKFKNQKVQCSTVKEFVVTDTIFRKSKHATEALNILENERKVMTVHNRKRHGYPEYVTLEFN